MAEGLLYRPVEDAELDALLRTVSTEYLVANGDTDVKILGTQLCYSNISGYCYQTVFEANSNEQGMLKIVFDHNNKPQVTEI